jgi:SAM-dependent methyltransferase
MTLQVLCSVTSVPQAIQEVQRVLKPGGQFLFLEHVIAPKERPVVRFAQQVLNPVQELLADGCHLNRNPLPTIREHFDVPMAKEFTVEGLGIIGPHVAGIAVQRTPPLRPL